MRMEPALGCSKPAIRRRQVVLPEPEGPSMEKNSPSWISMDTLSTALTSPNTRDTSVNCTARVIFKLQDISHPPATRPSWVCRHKTGELQVDVQRLNLS